MRRRVEAVAPLVPESIAAYQEKLAERLREAIGAPTTSACARRSRCSPPRSTSTRSSSACARISAKWSARSRQGAVGKRLDFLAQELNREANTLASKAARAAISDCALELKLLIEQMREQVQNIE